MKVEGHQNPPFVCLQGAGEQLANRDVTKGVGRKGEAIPDNHREPKFRMTAPRQRETKPSGKDKNSGEWKKVNTLLHPLKFNREREEGEGLPRPS